MPGSSDKVIRAQVVIGNETVESPFVEVHNPARTHEVVGEMAVGTAALADRAVMAAHEAFVPWAALSPAERRGYLLRAADRIDEGLDERIELLTSEQGKVLWESRLDVGFASTIVRGFAELSERAAEETVVKDARGTTVLRRRPTGVTAAVVPWNYPVYLGCLAVGPALAAGNTVVVKPSEFAPLALTATLAMMASELPDGVLNIVPGEGAEAGAALARHPLVRKMMFTGGTETGKQVLRDAAGNLKNVSLELGGNDPAIVLESARLGDELIAELRRAVFTCSGQVCFDVKRIYVHESLYEQLVELFTAAADEICVGDGHDPRSVIGPLNNDRQFSKVSGLLERTRNSGATVTTVGTKLDPSTWSDGYFMLPSVVTGIGDEAELVATEQFGPIIPIVAFRDEAEAIAMANRTEYGLAASVWSEDVDHALAVGRQIESGTVFVNTHRAGASSAEMPFGGFKQSGIGRNSGFRSIEECMETQALAHRVDPSSFPGPSEWIPGKAATAPVRS